MKISCLSDLHLEFLTQEYEYDLPDTDVLILAGDICCAHYLRSHRTDKDSFRSRKIVGNFFRKVDAKKYQMVIYIPGNHEYYKCDYDEAWDIIQGFIHGLGLKTNISFLNRNIDFVTDDKGPVLFAGATMWTDFNNQSRASMETCRQSLNDYHLIYQKGNPMYKLSPDDTLNEHLKSREWLEEIINKFPRVRIVAVTHHAPSKLSTHPKWANQYLMNGGYSSDLEYLMKENVKLWTHGHCHDSFDYFVNSTRIIDNPRGYKGHELNPNFNPHLVIEI